MARHRKPENVGVVRWRDRNLEVARDRERKRRADWTPEQRQKANDVVAAWTDKNKDHRKEYLREYGQRPENKARQDITRKRWLENRPEEKKIKDRDLDTDRKRLLRCGLTAKAYDHMLTAQNGVCAICKRPQVSKATKKLAIDHCHKTGKVRELLCMRCNVSLGFMDDSPERAEAMKQYLIKWSKN